MLGNPCFMGFLFDVHLLIPGSSGHIRDLCKKTRESVIDSPQLLQQQCLKYFP